MCMTISHYSEMGRILACGSGGSKDHVLKAYISEIAEVPVVQNGQRVIYDEKIKDKVHCIGKLSDRECRDLDSF